MVKFSLFFLMLLSSSAWSADCEKGPLKSVYKPRHAKLFTVSFYEDYKIVTSGNDKVLLAGSKKLNCETTLPIIVNPIKRLVATSTTHLAFLKLFSQEHILVGFQGTHYIYNPIYKAQKVKDIHYQLNSEELISLRPDLVMAYSANITDEKKLYDLRKLNIPVILNRDFEERTPLARAEWMVFSSLFIDKFTEAQKQFIEIETRYQAIKNSASTNKKIKVLVGDIKSGKWATCGGESDLAILLKDAGAELLHQSNSSETQYISLEKMLTQKHKPAVWLTQNTWTDLVPIKKDSRYKSFRNIKTYNNDRLLNPQGFNDYWETGVSRPDLLLLDLHSIIHPENNLKHELIWYRELR